MDTARAHQEFLRTRIFPGLDGLRCLSIVLVVAYHVSGLHHGFLGRGYLGVSLFFAISGFLITTLLLRERAGARAHLPGRASTPALAAHLPALLRGAQRLRAAGALLREGAQEKADFFGNLPAFLTYTSNWFVPLEPDTRDHLLLRLVLATEEQFYLLWPGVMRVGAPVGRRCSS